jgi:NADPH:quinone reductase-like Zn-dependent oxidoreductase
MKAAVLTGYGSVERLELREVPAPLPGRGEILVRVKAAGMNPLDWKLRAGKMRFVFRLRLPAVLGFDVAGVIEGLGSGVSRLRVGDEVFATTEKGGTHAELVSVAEGDAAAMPASMSFLEAAAVPGGALTALQALRDVAHLQPGQRVLVNGASGGVGTFAVQIARILGGQVAAVTSARNVDLVRSLGAEEVADYAQEDFTRRGKRYDVVFDVVPNRTFAACSRALTPSGVYVTTLPGPGPFLGRAAAALLRPFGFSRRCAWVMLRPSGSDLEILGRWADEGKLRAVVDRAYPLEQIRDAHLHVEGGHTRGKVVLKVG